MIFAKKSAAPGPRLADCRLTSRWSQPALVFWSALMVFSPVAQLGRWAAFGFRYGSEDGGISSSLSRSRLSRALVVCQARSTNRRFGFPRRFPACKVSHPNQSLEPTRLCILASRHEERLQLCINTVTQFPFGQQTAKSSCEDQSPEALMRL